MILPRVLERAHPFPFLHGEGRRREDISGMRNRDRPYRPREARVLLVSTDPASNLDEMLGVALSDAPTPVPDAPGLSALNIDPEAAAETYRERVLAQLDPGTSAGERSTVREQLSGACTTEIAAFDEFVGLLAGDRMRVRSHYLRYRPNRAHPKAAQSPESVDRLFGGQRPGRVLSRSAFRPEDAGGSLPRGA